MLARSLLSGEVELVRRAEAFVRENHHNEGGHDHAHVLAVTDYALRIAEGSSEPADPFVVVLGALFHDLGRVGADTGVMHGLRGAAVAREWLQSTTVPGEVRERVLRVIARHTPTTRFAPETVEERVVYDADALDRLGIMGMLRGLIGKRGSTGHIIEDRIQKRLGDYDRLHFPVSRRMGEALHAESLTVVERFRAALTDEAKQLQRIPWPVAAGVAIPVPALSSSSASQGTSSLGDALVRAQSRDPVPIRPGSEAPAAVLPSSREWSRCLTGPETALVERIAQFVQIHHAQLKAHDYAHVLSVVKNAIRIARTLDERPDPFVLLCGALLHDIGWVGSTTGSQHGLRGASLAHEYLCSTWVPADTRDRIRRVIVRHSVSSGHPPETVEERVVWDADGLAGVGLIGVARGVISGVGSMDQILEACLRYAGKRAENLHFEESRRIADALSADGRSLIRTFVKALKERKERVERLRLPA